jgi:hypothetical protein
MIVSSSGYIGINNSSPTARLYVTASQASQAIVGDKWDGVAIWANGHAVVGQSLTVGGTIQDANLGTGTGTQAVIDSAGYLRKLSSSARYKHNVANLPAACDDVLALRPVSFEWNSSGEPDIGLIAEEVAKVIPDLVICDTEGRPDAVKYERLSVYLLQVVKSQRDEIAAQEDRLTALERELEELKAEVRKAAPSTK